MRQAGVLAAAGLIALEESPEDSAPRSRKRAASGRRACEIEGIAVDPTKVHDEHLAFRLSASNRPHGRGFLRGSGGAQVLCGPTAKVHGRMVTHYDVDRAGMERALMRRRRSDGGAGSGV